MKEIEYCIRVASNANADADITDANRELLELKHLAEIGKALIELNGRKLGVFINIEKMLSDFRNGMVE